jgi:hypothetical protein
MLSTDQLQTVKHDLQAIGFQNVILAGGAPRDMYLDRAPRDYDFYVYMSDDHYEPEDHDFYEEGFDFVEYTGQDYPGTPTNNILSVWEMDGYGSRINVIVLNQTFTPTDLVDSFHCSLSKFYYDFETRSPVATPPARLAIATKRITFSDNCSNNYIEKISSYFPEYAHCTYEQIALVLIEQAVNSVPKSSNITGGASTLTASTASTPWWHHFDPVLSNPLRGISPGTILRDEVNMYT